MADDAPPDANIAKLQFHYIKGQTYREVPCHGVVGGVTPQGKIWMAMFSERGAIPRLVEFNIPKPDANVEVDFDEQSSTPARIESRNGIVRHIEHGVYLDLNTAEAMIGWLTKRVAELKGPKK